LEVQADEWEDRVDTVSRGLLGLTVACARCHDHKFDPISTEDYYALAGVFASTEMYNRPMGDGVETDKKGQAKSPAEAMHVVREAQPTDLNVFIRGDVERKGPLVHRRFLRVCSSGEPLPFREGSGRAELARQITSRENPLTARVLVNRVWANVFGSPLVGTPSNFGSLGAAPTHPELLDDLAAEFVASDWSLKRLQRRLVLSSVFRRSSEFEEESYRLDSPNRWYWRANRRRLDMEMWRDSVLAASGSLDLVLGGRSLQADSIEECRRSVYSRVSRFDLDPIQALFDFPDPNAHAEKRNQTTTPLQKLFVMNSPFMRHHAERLARRLTRVDALGDGGVQLRQVIQRGFWLSLGRSATPREVDMAVQFIESAANADAAIPEFAHMLLASNEMLFVD
jgi:hypothetical protein